MYRTVQDKQLILGSASPRRQQMLAALGLQFTVRPLEVKEEITCARSLGREAQRLAIVKALAFGPLEPNQVLLTADTLVGIDGRILGKPAGPEEAGAMLSLLSGRSHQVVTGFCLQGSEPDGWMESGFQLSRVTFRNLSPAEIKAYVASKEPLDKAGAYGVQEKGAALVESIEGSFHNVVGLPLAKIIEKMLIYNVIVPEAA